MINWILSSSVLIMIILLLRLIFRGRLSLRLRYALWLPVLFRLLLPLTVGSSSISVLNTLPEAGPAPQIRFEITPVATQAVEKGGAEVSPSPPAVSEAPSLSPVVYEKEMDLTGILYWTYGCGAGIVGLSFLIIHLQFRRRLRHSRRPFVYSSPRYVYVTEAVETPCLFGLFRPGIYVPPEVAEDPETMAHCVVHEETHYRHGDHIWAVLRCLCFALHWYNPLVWLGAVLSGRDAELACDEAAIRRLGEERREAYGHTLLFLSSKESNGPSLTVSTMTGGKKYLKERITCIVKKPKMAFYTPVVLLLICAMAVGCTFSDRAKEQILSEERGAVTINRSELDDEPSATFPWHEMEDGYVYRLPNVSVPMDRPVSVCPLYGEYFGGREANDPKWVYPDEGLQALATELARKHNIATVSGALEYAYGILPYLEEMPVLYLGGADIYLASLFPLDNGVCLAGYKTEDYPGNYWALPPEERIQARTESLDGGFSVAFSIEDGHVISLQDAFSGMMQPGEPYGTMEKIKSTKKMISVYLKYEDLTLADQVLLGRGEGYRSVPKDPSTRWDDSELQAAAIQAAEGLVLYRAEDMQIYGQSLAELIPQKRTIFGKSTMKLRRMTRYADGVWEFQYWDRKADQIGATVFVSETDGHIIHILEHPCTSCTHAP